MRSTALVASRSVRCAHHAVRRPQPALVPGRGVAPRPVTAPNRRTVGVKASETSDKQDVDFDQILIILAKKWDAAENKAVVVGWSAAAVFLLFFSEWFIHLPVMDWILGFPIQLVGLFTVPYITVRWLVKKQDWFDDVSKATGAVVDVLPGLKSTGSKPSE